MELFLFRERDPFLLDARPVHHLESLLGRGAEKEREHFRVERPSPIGGEGEIHEPFRERKETPGGRVHAVQRMVDARAHAAAGTGSR